MFFSKTKKAEAETALAKNIENDKRFADKLAAITEINLMISDTISKTHEANTDLLLKLKKHLKHGAKSFISLSDKLTSGVFILNYKGDILQINHKACEILNCCNASVGTHIIDLITVARPSDQDKPIFLSPEFFFDLSASTLNAILNKSEIPTSLLSEEELVKIKSSKLEGEKCMKFTFSLLDNDADEITDIIYVVIFRPIRTEAKTDNFNRRETDLNHKFSLQNH